MKFLPVLHRHYKTTPKEILNFDLGKDGNSLLPRVSIPKQQIEKNVETIADFISRRKKLFILSGAGLSTYSGLPDYQKPGSRENAIRYQEFLSSLERRKRYYARNVLGFELFRKISPNSAHYSVSELQNIKGVHCNVTQNVDGLLQKAGCHDVVELHGSNHEIICISCRSVLPRFIYQRQLLEENKHFFEPLLSKLVQSRSMNPDGDLQLPEVEHSLILPPCRKCGGIQKPNVTFFGENIPSEIKEYSFDMLRDSDGLLVLGSSLEVNSGRRFAIEANKLGIPIAIVNIGQTKADHMASLKTDALLHEFLPMVIQQLTT